MKVHPLVRSFGAVVFWPYFMATAADELRAGDSIRDGASVWTLIETRRVVRSDPAGGNLTVSLTAARNEWEGFQKRRREAERRFRQKGKAFTLLAFLEGVSRSVGVDGKIQYMKPLTFHESDNHLKPSGIEITLNDIHTKHLTNLIYKIEASGKLLNINRIKIQRVSKDKMNLLKVTLQVYTYKAT